GESIVWSAGFGYEDVEQKRPASAQTVYRVGSVSKLFTDLAVMREVEEGRVALDTPITKILPDFHPHNPFDQPITLGQLMSHRSGLVREPPVGHYFDPTQPALEATIASLNETTLVYRPGSRTKYSNAGVSVVGYALSRMRGESFESLIERTLLQPMELTSTSFRLTPKLKPRAAVGWMWSYDGRRFAAPTFPLGTGPAGNLYSSVEDLARFWTILFRGGKTKQGHVVVRPETLEAMWTPQRDAQGRPTSFGIGFHVQKLDGHRKVGHGGAIYGFATQLEGLPDEKLGVAAVAALDGANGVVTRLCEYALRLLLAQQAGNPLPDYERTKPIPRSVARKLAGTYTDGKRNVWLRELGGTLTLRSGVTETTVRQRADGSLVVDSPLAFGTPVKLENSTLHVGSRRYQRIDNGPPPPAPQRWQGLIGEYGWDHNTLYILEDHGQLYALIEWFFYYPLKELSPTEFAFPDYGLYHGEEIVFRLGEDGRATEAIAAGIQFARRNVGTRSGETFRIQPVRPVEELR
ncbi:MAG TPA: class A beta-lactamase-related serine hydrolase, partial [Planctomycetaceae bacterium]|nr:class A beta-lactamase-related serine hydrolase [Planctomycetaceae bacterium]